MKDKTIIITGASDGIGRAAATNLKSSGANIVITGSSVECIEGHNAGMPVKVVFLPYVKGETMLQKKSYYKLFQPPSKVME